ncbi:hypothetical protein [Polaromonas sp. CG9_12]|nr:hypothetical protein [Polaromonas sp. CG9_12]CDS48051.1 hypothetical protein [Polaromonas sp. CG9_12]
MKAISGQDPTAAQIARVTAIAHDFDIPKNDAMFPIMVMMDQYHGVFSELPAKMRKAADEVAKAAADNTKHQVNLGLVQAIEKMGPQIGEALVGHAKALHQVDQAKWIGAVVLGVALAFAGTAWLTHTSGYSSGFETGKAAGYQAATDEKAMAAWANTDQGRLAYELAQAGNLEMLAHCNGQGWNLSKGICLPYPYQDGKGNSVTGWHVGKSAGGTPSRKLNVSWFDSLFGSDA